MFWILILVQMVTNSALARTLPRNNLPPFLQICRRNDPNLNECVMASIEALRPYLKEGIPELNVPKCEPLLIPELSINQGSAAISLHSKYTDIVVDGPSKFQVKKVRIDLENDRVHIDLLLPYLHTQSNYTMHGRILILPIQGKGRINNKYSDIVTKCAIQAEKFQKNGESYWNIVDFFLDFDIGHAVIKMEDMFNGDEKLGTTMNTFLNENWRTVAEDIKPTLEKTIGDMFKTIANQILHKYPISQLLPD